MSAKGATAVRSGEWVGAPERTENKELEWWQVEWLDAAGVWQMIAPRRPNQARAVKAMRQVMNAPTWKGTRIRARRVVVVERTEYFAERTAGAPTDQGERLDPANPRSNPSL